MACARRAEVAAYSECTEAQMMAMFGWRDHKMPSLYIAKANRDKLAIGGMVKIEAYDQMENIADLAMPAGQNRIVTFESNRRKKILRFQPQVWRWCARRDSNPHDFTHCHLKAARLPIPPRARRVAAGEPERGRINGADVTNRLPGYKTCEWPRAGVLPSDFGDFTGFPAVSAASA